MICSKIHQTHSIPVVNLAHPPLIYLFIDVIIRLLLIYIKNYTDWLHTCGLPVMGMGAGMPQV